ncbi:MAG: cytidine deaminase [Bacteroidota bacterium]
MAFLFQTLLRRSYVPYSNDPNAAIAVLADGRWIPGVRIESASFPLTIPAVTAALVGAQALVGLEAVVGVHAHKPFTVAEHDLIQVALGRPTRAVTDHTVLIESSANAPDLDDPVDIPDLIGHPQDGTTIATAAFIQRAREEAMRRARVPHSDFPVGCIVETRGGVAVPGVNVEFDDWTRGLCAERTALALTLAYGLVPAALYISCIKAPGGTPCGACRQVIAELVPDGPIWIDHHDAPPRKTTAQVLLPDAFVGDGLLHAPTDRSA